MSDRVHSPSEAGAFPVRNRYFPFRALGLRWNPFRALTVEEWPEVVVLPSAVLEALDQTAARIQILGEAGRGKTSSLLGLAARLRREGKRVAYEYIPLGQTRFRSVVADLDTLILDEAQRLAKPERDRLATQSERLVIGSHEDLTPVFARHRLPLATVGLNIGAVSHLRAVLERRLAWSALPGGSGVSFGSDAVQWVHGKYGGDLRGAQYFLYEVFQTLSRPGEITAATLEESR